MTSKLYVGNLPYSTTEDSLREIFAPFGGVKSVQIIRDRETNLSKGFGFVEMESQDVANNCIEDLNNSEVDGRRVTVSAARESKPRKRWQD